LRLRQSNSIAKKTRTATSTHLSDVFGDGNQKLFSNELREACDKALVDAMKIARKSLERTMERFISQKAAENQTKYGKFAH